MNPSKFGSRALGAALAEEPGCEVGGPSVSLAGDTGKLFLFLATPEEEDPDLAL